MRRTTASFLILPFLVLGCGEGGEVAASNEAGAAASGEVEPTVLTDSEIVTDAPGEGDEHEEDYESEEFGCAGGDIVTPALDRAGGRAEEQEEPDDTDGDVPYEPELMLDEDDPCGNEYPEPAGWSDEAVESVDDAFLDED